MNILITGTNGFIGRNLASYLYTRMDVKSHRVVPINKGVLNLLSREDVKNYFNTFKFDVVVHCAIEGGNRTQENIHEVYDTNMNMFNNILMYMKPGTRLINFGSGAEFINGHHYGRAKRHMNAIGRHELGDSYAHVRLYGCFGPYESGNRFIRTAMLNYANSKPIVIHQDKLMDFVYIKDVIGFISKLVFKYELDEYNLVYKDKYTLHSIANVINNLEEKKVPIELETPYIGEPYIGEYKEWDHSFGIEEGIADMRRTL